MAEKDLQSGIILIILAVFFLFSTIGLFEYEYLSENYSAVLAFVLVSCGIYLVTKK